MRAWLAATSAAVLATSLLGASGAAAATEFGDACVGNDATEGSPVTVFEIAAPGNPLPIAAPSAGVITKWKVNVVPAPVSISQGLRVLRLDTTAHTAQIVGEASATLTGGFNSFDTRIPVLAGDRVALFGSDPTYAALVCEDPAENFLAAFAGGGGGVGSSALYFESPPLKERVPVSAVLEPDVDGDGYGDETQDQCPRSAAAQAECPPITLDSFPLAKKRKVVVLVATNATAPVTVSGNAKLPKAGRRARSSATAKLKSVTKTVAAGKLVRFTLRLPRKLKAALRGLPRRRSITVRLTATATDLAGQKVSDRAKVRLKG